MGISCYSQKYISVISCRHWRSLGLFSSEATRRAQQGEKMLGGSGGMLPRKLKKMGP
jgi:hypothetical protein